MRTRSHPYSASQAGHEIKSSPVISLWQYLAMVNSAAKSSNLCLSHVRSHWGPAWLRNNVIVVNEKFQNCFLALPHTWRWGQILRIKCSFYQLRTPDFSQSSSESSSLSLISKSPILLILELFSNTNNFFLSSSLVCNYVLLFLNCQTS